MDKLKRMLTHFLKGRYGPDEFYKFLFISFIIIWILQIIFRNPILYILGIAICGYAIFRMFSRNFLKRQEENRKYIKIRDNVKKKIKRQIKISKDKTHIYRKCPNCKAQIRLPKKKGKHTCTCPKCKKDFKIKC